MSTTPIKPDWITPQREVAAQVARRSIVEGGLHEAIKRPDDPALSGLFEATMEIAGRALFELDQAHEYDRSNEAIVGSQLIAVSMAECFGTPEGHTRMGELLPNSLPELSRVACTLAGIVNQLVTEHNPGMQAEEYARMRQLMITNNARTPEENGDNS